MTEEKKYYTEEYWFDNPINDEWHQGGEKYYVNNFYEQIVFKLDIPKTGKIVLLGTHNCVSFDKLCKHFGYDRVVGYDLYNPKMSRSTFIKHVVEIMNKTNYTSFIKPMAEIDIDLVISKGVLLHLERFFRTTKGNNTRKLKLRHGSHFTRTRR